MNFAKTRLRELTCAAAAALCMTFSSGSQAAAFQVEFDPPAELYGFATFFLSEPCLAVDNNYNTLSELWGLAQSGCFITFEGALISTTGTGGELASYEAIFPLVLFSSLLIENHQLAGITTLIALEPVNELALLASSTLLSTYGHHECVDLLAFKAPSESNPSGSVKFAGCDASGNPLPVLTGNVISIAQVPEPGTLALLFGAGIAGWWSRRRRIAA